MGDSVELTLFLLISFWCLLSALLTVEAEKIMHAIVWLVNLMIGVGALFIFLTAEFLGMVQLIVYAGGIMVLMLFGIMLTGKDPIFPPNEFVSWKKALPLALLFLSLGIYSIASTTEGGSFPSSDNLLPTEIENPPTPTEALRTVALALFNDYWVVILILGVVLLAALIGSIYLIKKEPWDTELEGGNIT